jgi:uncharacterized protein
MLLDTSGLLILADNAEPQHSAAVEFLAAAFVVVTHNYVIDEWVALATRRRLPRAQMLEFIRVIETTPEIKLVFVDRELHTAALDLLRQRLDKEWTLCDAVSFVLMQRLNLQEALTTDHHFEQAGFTRLLLA